MTGTHEGKLLLEVQSHGEAVELGRMRGEEVHKETDLKGLLDGYIK